MGNVTCRYLCCHVFQCFCSTLGVVGSKYHLSSRVTFPPLEAKREREAKVGILPLTVDGFSTIHPVKFAAQE